MLHTRWHIRFFVEERAASSGRTDQEEELTMETYTTQMDAARKGIVTPQMEIVARKERMPVDRLMALVAEGKVAICANKLHTCLDPEGVGSMLRTKINVNLGARITTWRWKR